MRACHRTTSSIYLHTHTAMDQAELTIHPTKTWECAASDALCQCSIIIVFLSCFASQQFLLQMGRYYFIFSCDQAALWMVYSFRLSVCLSVCPSVCLSHLFDYVRIIVSSWNFQELLPMTKVTSMQKVKVRGQRSRSQRSTPNLTVSGL